MTILQGTMQDGTVIPVQVDAQGRLVAEGLQGPPGTDGISLPPGAADGQLLGWKNGQLAWFTGELSPPDPRPKVGPITAVETVAGRKYSDRITMSTRAFTAPSDLARAFDGGTGTGAMALWENGDTNELWIKIDFVPSVHVGSLLRVWTVRGTYYQAMQDIEINGAVTNWNNTTQSGWTTVPFTGELSSIWYGVRRGVTTVNQYGESMGINAVEVDGNVLQDGRSVTRLTAAGQSVAALSPGMAIKEEGGSADASGVVASVDAAAATVTLTTTAPGWTVGAYIRGTA